MTRFLILAVSALLAACGPQTTPFPADMATTPTAAVQSGDAASIRYALAANTQGFVPDLKLIRASAQVEELNEPINPDDLGSRYDIVVAYGELWHGMSSPTPPHIALVIRADRAPLNNPVLLDVLKRGVNPSAIVVVLTIEGAVADSIATEEPRKLRADLANMGWPDGFSLNMAYAYTPGISALVEQFQELGIRVQPILMNETDLEGAFGENHIQMALVAWTTQDVRASWVERFGNDYLIDLYTLPISYRAVPDLKITFTPHGWPLASR